MDNVVRGKLKLKASGKLKVSAKHKKSKKHKKDKKHKKVSHEEERGREEEGDRQHGGDIGEDEIDVADDLTPAQRRHEEHRKKREQEEIDKMAGKTYRQRVEELNQYLGSLTEHHDIPRVSAAGNG